MPTGWLSPGFARGSRLTAGAYRVAHVRRRDAVRVLTAGADPVALGRCRDGVGVLAVSAHRVALAGYRDGGRLSAGAHR
ncbi:hypothetical protein [Streptomyces sp. NPDC001667]